MLVSNMTLMQCMQENHERVERVMRRKVVVHGTTHHYEVAIQGQGWIMVMQGMFTISSLHYEVLRVPSGVLQRPCRFSASISSGRSRQSNLLLG